MSISHMRWAPPTWWSNQWRPGWTHDHWKISVKSSRWCQYPIQKMVMVKSVHVTQKVAREWGPRVSDTLGISEQTGNNSSPWSTRNSQSSWSYGPTYALTYVVRRLAHEPFLSLDRQRHGLSTIITSHQLIVYTTSHHKSQIRRPTILMLSYPWPWWPQDIRQVSKSDICHGTMANHHLTLYHRADNNRQEQISTRSIKGEQWHPQEYTSWKLNVDPHFSHAPPLDRWDLLLFGEDFIFGKVRVATYFILF